MPSGCAAHFAISSDTWPGYLSLHKARPRKRKVSFLNTTVPKESVELCNLRSSAMKGGCQNRRLLPSNSSALPGGAGQPSTHYHNTSVCSGSGQDGAKTRPQKELPLQPHSLLATPLGGSYYTLRGPRGPPATASQRPVTAPSLQPPKSETAPSTSPPLLCYIHHRAPNSFFLPHK